MPRTEIRYTYIAKRKYWRFRHKAIGDCPLPGTPDDAAFHAKYAELMARVESRPVEPEQDSWSDFIKRYRASAEFSNLAESTKADYARTLDILDKELGVQPFKLTTRAMIKAVRDDFKDNPRKAHKVQQMASALYGWADQETLIAEGLNPVKGLKRMRNPNGKEYICWSAHEFDILFASTIKPMQIAIMLGRYTGQRAEDVVSMTWKHFQGDTIRVRQSKTRKLVDVACPKALKVYLDTLKRDLDREKRRGVMILTSAEGKPYNANSLSSAIGRAVLKAAEETDFPHDRSFHGLRYMAGAELEEAGCTVAEIEGVLGHETFKMAMKYASQRLRSKTAAAKRDASS